KANSGETLQTHSTDGGKTWAEPYAIDVWGLPSHRLRLADDRLLMTYGHRRAPLGNQARISTDNGQTWSESIIIYGEATSGDLGYPSTVEIAANQFVTVWYEKLSDNSFAQLRMARWQLG
ncbi:MAG: exo-alpha-sialidase, partial [Fuerstiella sp.]|nr:exo-alpha-sialidase [Fuerstiella sp.]